MTADGFSSTLILLVVHKFDSFLCWRDVSWCWRAEGTQTGSTCRHKTRTDSNETWSDRKDVWYQECVSLTWTVSGYDTPEMTSVNRALVKPRCWWFWGLRGISGIKLVVSSLAESNRDFSKSEFETRSTFSTTHRSKIDLLSSTRENLWSSSVVSKIPSAFIQQSKNYLQVA